MWVHTKRKAACVATSGPSLGRKRPRWAAIAGSASAGPIDKTTRLAAQLNVGTGWGSKRGNGLYEGEGARPSKPIPSARRRPSLLAHYVEHRGPHHCQSAFKFDPHRLPILTPFGRVARSGVIELLKRNPLWGGDCQQIERQRSENAPFGDRHDLSPTRGNVSARFFATIAKPRLS
jgi:hypothetical protein